MQRDHEHVSVWVRMPMSQVLLDLRVGVGSQGVYTVVVAVCT